MRQMDLSIIRKIEAYKKLTIQVKASLWGLVSGIIQKGVSVLSTPIFTRILTTEEYAEYTLFQSWEDIIIIFISLNVYNYATYTALSKFETDRRRFILSAQSLVTFLAALWLGIVIVLTDSGINVSEFPKHILILMIADILFMASYNLWVAFQRYDFHYRAMTIVSVIIGFLRPFVGIVLIYFNVNRNFARIYGLVSVNVLFGLVFYCINCKKASGIFSVKYWRFILTFCLPLIPHFLSAQILSRFDRIMISKMCSTSAVAIYSLGYNISSLMLIVSDAVLNSITPWIYQSVKCNKSNQIKKATNEVILLIASANFALALFAPELVRIFAPETYYEAIYIIPAVSASVYFMFLFNIFATIEYYHSETKYVALASVVAAVINIVLNKIFIMKFGYIAAGYTTLISYIAYSIFHYCFMRVVCRKCDNGMKYFDGRFIFIVSAIFIMLVFLIIILYDKYIVRYIFLLVLFTLFFIMRKKIFNLFKRKN